MQAALIGGRQRKKGHYLTPWTAQLLPLFVSDLKPDHLSGSGLFWDAAVCRRDSLRCHTKHSDGMTDLESSSSPPNRCPAPVAQPPLRISRISSQSAPSSGDTHICTHTYVCVHTHMCVCTHFSYKMTIQDDDDDDLHTHATFSYKPTGL